MGTKLRAGLVKIADVDFHPHNVRRDLGDLRSLTASIVRYGVMQPVVVEEYGERLRLRAGHRRVVAAGMAGLSRIPAVVHGVALDDDEWLIQAVEENVKRRDLTARERVDAVAAMRDFGCTWAGIADTFGVSVATVRRWMPGDALDQVRLERRRRKSAERRATRRLVEAHEQEYKALVAQELDQTVSAVAGPGIDGAPAGRERWQRLTQDTAA